MKIRALVIEDNSDDVELLREMLRETDDVEVEFAPRLGEGLARLGGEKFDAVIVDMNLPDSTGLETVQKVKQRASDLPILVLTHQEDEAVAIRAVQAGAQDFLVKGQLNGRLLERSIRYAMERQQMAGRLAAQAETLQQSEASLRNIVTGNADGMAIIDGEGVVLFVNPGAERMFASRAKDLVGGNFGRPVAGKHRAELKVLQKGGDTLVVEMGVTEITWQGEPAFLASLRDITSRKQSEGALRETNERLVSSLSRLERQAAEISRLSEMGEMLQSCQTEAEAHRVAEQMLEQLFGQDSGALFILEQEKNVVEAVTVWGANQPKVTVFSPEDCWALRRGRTHATEAGRQAARCVHADERGTSHAMCIPMNAQGETLGVLHVVQGCTGAESGKAGQEEWREREKLAQAVAEQFSLALANLRLRETLRKQSIHDPLTGLYNRRFMEEWLERAVRRARREMRPLGVLMVDVDHFKEINDRFGHEGGDALLRTLGAMLPERVRAGDVVCRYGGEEFVLLLQDGDLAVARQRGEQILADMGKLELTYRGSSLGKISVSVGVAAYPLHGETVEELLRAADAALYRAKEGGRNRLEVAEALRTMTVKGGTGEER